MNVKRDHRRVREKDRWRERQRERERSNEYLPGQRLTAVRVSIAGKSACPLIDYTIFSKGIYPGQRVISRHRGQE